MPNFTDSVEEFVAKYIAHGWNDTEIAMELLAVYDTNALEYLVALVRKLLMSSTEDRDFYVPLPSPNKSRQIKAKVIRTERPIPPPD